MAVRSRLVRLLAVLAVAGTCGVLSADAASAAPVTGPPSVVAMPSIPGIPDCKDAPLAERPGTGLPGALDPAPDPVPAAADPFASTPTTSVYEQYGYAGLSWHTYDLGCGGSVRDPAAATDTMIGNLLLSAAVWLTAATNGLHNHVADPASYMAPLDRVVTAVTTRLSDAIWSPWGAVALLAVAALLLYQAMRGQLSAVVAGAGWALLVLAVLAAVTAYPARAASFFDDTITTTIGSLQARTAGLHGTTTAGPDAARAQGALTVDRVLYDAWLRGQLGATDTGAARRWGPVLFDAQAVSWSEAAAATTPEAVKELTERKAEQWKDTAAEIADQDPATYTVLQGKAGGRTGTGLMALLGAVFVDLFRLVADVFLLAGLVMLRLLVMFLPAAAVIGVLAPLSGIVKQMANTGGAAVVNVVAFSAGSVVYTAAITAILNEAGGAGMSIMALVLCLVITLAAFVLMAPLLSFTRVLGHSGRIRSHRLSRLLTRYAITRKGVNDGASHAIKDTQETQEPSSAAGEEQQPAGKRRRAPATPRAETFARAQPVWDITSDGGVAHTPRSRPVDRITAGQERPSPPRTSQPPGPPATPKAGQRTSTPTARNADPRPSRRATWHDGHRDGSTSGVAAGNAGWMPTRPAPDTSSGVAARNTGWVPTRTVITGQVLDRQPTAVAALTSPPHEGNTDLAPDGAGYYVYDAGTGETIRHPAPDGQRAAEDER